MKIVLEVEIDGDVRDANIAGVLAQEMARLTKSHSNRDKVAITMAYSVLNDGTVVVPEFGGKRTPIGSSPMTHAVPQRNQQRKLRKIAK